MKKNSLSNLDFQTSEENVSQVKCDLELSADKNWLRLIVNEKLVATFHAAYVQKVLDGSNIQKNDTPEKRQPSATI